MDLLAANQIYLPQLYIIKHSYNNQIDKPQVVQIFNTCIYFSKSRIEGLNMRVLFTLIVLAWITIKASGQQLQDVKRLTYSLLVEYDKYMRPVINQSTILEVGIM